MAFYRKGVLAPASKDEVGGAATVQIHCLKRLGVGLEWHLCDSPGAVPAAEVPVQMQKGPGACCPGSDS